MKKQSFIFVLSGSLFLQACAENPIATDEMPMLKQDEGIAGIVFDSTAIELTSIEFDSVSKRNGKLHVPDVPVGQSVFLFVTEAGRYCLDNHTLAKNGINISPRPEILCFNVEAGKISYSGTFTLSFTKEELLSGMQHLTGRLTRENDPDAFLDMLSRSYPRIVAAAFPPK